MMWMHQMSLLVAAVTGGYRLTLEPIPPFTWFGLGLSTLDVVGGLRLCIVLRQLREMSLRHHLESNNSRNAGDGSGKDGAEVEPMSYVKHIAITLVVVFGGEAIMSTFHVSTLFCDMSC